MTKGSDIDRQAAKWSVRYERELTQQEQAELSQWLEADVRHAGAYARARAVAHHSLRLSALGPEAATRERLALSQGQAVSRRTAIAAGLVVAMTGVGTGAALLRREQSYRTGLGEVRSFTLADGSLLTLSALSSVSVRMDEDRRDVVMTEGEAFLDVASGQRPLQVFAAGTRIVAGTGRILLRRYGQDPLYVTPLDRSASISTQKRSLTVAAHEKMAMSRVPVRVELDSEDIERALAWKQGRLALHDETLGSAARTFARFSEIKLAFDNESTALKRLTGLFDVRDPLGFARAAALSLDLQVVAGQDVVQLISKN